MMSVYFFTGIFFTLGFNAFLSQVADDFVTGVLSIVGGVISSVVVAWCKNRWERKRSGRQGKGVASAAPFWVYKVCKVYKVRRGSFQYDENFCFIR